METCVINRPVRSTAPTVEPVSLDEAKKALGLPLDGSYHDDPLTTEIQTARAMVEDDTGIVCLTGTYTLKLTDWPEESYFELRGLRPVTSITSIAYTAVDGTSTTWSSSYYSLDTAPVQPVIKLVYGQYWPTLRGDINGVTVTMVAGYATAAAVPAMVKEAVLCAVALNWKTKAGENTRGYQELYDRAVNRLGRATYP